MKTLIGGLFIPGHPRPKGSLDVVNARRKVLADSDESTTWRALMAYKLRAEYAGAPPALGPVFVVADFLMPVSPEAVTTRQVGDLDKLIRNLFDALADDPNPRKRKLVSGVIKDDSQVVSVKATMRSCRDGIPGALARPSGVYVAAYELEDW